MDMLGIAILFTVGVGIYILWDKFFNNAGKERFVIAYSEMMGDNEVDHAKTYQAKTDKEGNTIFCKSLDIEMPYPPAWAKVTTRDNKTMLRIVKIDNKRYLYRIPTKDHSVWVYKRDNEGKIIKENGKSLLVKKEWVTSDDYVEPETRNWVRLRTKELQEKYKMKDKWAEWRPLIAMGMVFVLAIIAMKFAMDSFNTNAQAIAGKIENQQSQAQQTLDMLNRMVDRTTGTQQLDTEENKKDPHAPS